MKNREVVGLDVFRSAQAQDIGARWQKAQDLSREAAQRMWLGMLVSTFTEFELGILRDMGFLSQHDEQLLENLRGHRGGSSSAPSQSR